MVPDQQRDGVAGDGAVLAETVDVFVGLTLEVDLVVLAVEQGGEVLADVVLVGAELGPLEDDGNVEVAEGVPGFAHEPVGLGDEEVGGGVLPAGVVVGEELADVGLGESAEDGVGGGVVDDIAVAVPGWAAVVVEFDAADDEGAAGFEAVEVEAVADPVGERGGRDFRFSIFDFRLSRREKGGPFLRV